VQIRLRQHGTLPLLCVIFAPAGAKMTHRLNLTDKRKPYFCISFLRSASAKRNTKRRKSTIAKTTLWSSAQLVLLQAPQGMIVEAQIPNCHMEY
jgi:hypothetical protein